MEPEELRGLIQEGESQKLEFKQSLASEGQIIEALCGFLNSEGGRVLVGVSDDQQIIGLDVGHQTLERLAGNISQSIDPQPIPTIETVEIDGRMLLIIEVQARRVGFVSFAKERAWIRVGRTTRRLSAEEIRQRHLESAATIERLTEITTIRARLEGLDRQPRILGRAMFQVWVEGLTTSEERERVDVGAIEVAQDVARLDENRQRAVPRADVENGPTRSPWPSRVGEVDSAIRAGLVTESTDGRHLYLTRKGRVLADAVRLNHLLGGPNLYS